MATKAKTQKSLKKVSNIAFSEIFSILCQAYPDAHCALLHRNAFELLCATVLSAQCTDERVNKVTPELFRHYPTAQAMSQAPVAQLEKLIGSINFFRNKAKALLECSQSLVAHHGGEVPRTMQELTALRGVGRKTANVVLGNAFGIPSLVVDTHVGRLSRRLGFTKKLDPVEVEQDLMKVVPKQDWTMYAHLLIFHGRNRCMARNPNCKECEVSSLCPKVGVQAQ